MTKIRPEPQTATLDQANEISNLVNSVYRGEKALNSWTTEAMFLGGQRTDPDSLRQIIGSPHSVILTFSNRGRICGSVVLERRPQSAYLGMLTVDLKLQNSGLGGHILNTAERWAKEQWQSPKMEMTVFTIRTELLEWYQRKGYRRTGRFEPFPYGDEKFGIPLRDDLKFEVLEKSL